MLIFGVAVNDDFFKDVWVESLFYCIFTYSHVVHFLFYDLPKYLGTNRNKVSHRLSCKKEN